MKKLFSVFAAVVMAMSLLTVTAFAASNNVSSAYASKISSTDSRLVVQYFQDSKQVAEQAIGSSAARGLPANAVAVDAVDIHWSDGSVALSANLPITLTGTNVPSGAPVYVLHRRSTTNTWKLYSATNKGNGTISFTVPRADGLSPFVIFTTGKKSPSTGDVSAMLLAVAAVSSVVSVTSFTRSKKED